jgi:UDP-N-acetylmuramate dehydrogenase
MNALESSVPLQQRHTFGLVSQARYAVDIQSLEALRAASGLARAEGLPLTILGEGSNVILAGDLPAVVAFNRFDGLRVVEETPDTITVEVGAGRNWDTWVQHALLQGWFGLENLTAIPGTVGAAPVQNIGAYGVELADRFLQLSAWDRDHDAVITMDAAACGFGYRNSVFKRADAANRVILSVTFYLDRVYRPVLHYGGLQEAFAGEEAVDARAVSDQVRTIRASKLPDPTVLPNAGSFFKNPVIAAAPFEALRAVHAGIVGYPVAGDATRMKVAAGWLIATCGFKGKRHGGVGVHAQHALVLVNHGGGTIEQLAELVAMIREGVRERFGIALVIEPRVMGEKAGLLGEN